MKTIGFFFSCFTEKRAVEYALSELVKYYSESPIYLVSDGGLDYSYLKSRYRNLYTSLEEDTMSETFKITGDLTTGNFRDEYYQEVIKKCALTVLDRLERAIDYCKTDYILMMDPDTLVRGILTIPEGSKLLGSRVNVGMPQGIKEILKEHEGAKVIDCWGATPALFESQTFLRALSHFKENIGILDKFTQEFYAMYAHDVLLPILFALIGEEETFNPEIIECNRDPSWRSKFNPLVHQFKEYYE